MKLAVTYPDHERIVKESLKDLLAVPEPTVTVALTVPGQWSVDSPDHLQVVLDGTNTASHPIAARGTVRVVARSASATRAKALAWLAHGLLLGAVGLHGIAAVSPGTGVLPTYDPSTGAELASFTVLVTARSVPIPG